MHIRIDMHRTSITTAIIENFRISLTISERQHGVDEVVAQSIALDGTALHFASAKKLQHERAVSTKLHKSA